MLELCQKLLPQNISVRMPCMDSQNALVCSCQNILYGQSECSSMLLSEYPVWSVRMLQYAPVRMPCMVSENALVCSCQNALYGQTECSSILLLECPVWSVRML